MPEERWYYRSEGLVGGQDEHMLSNEGYEDIWMEMESKHYKSKVSEDGPLSSSYHIPLSLSTVCMLTFYATILERHRVTRSHT